MDDEPAGHAPACLIRPDPWDQTSLMERANSVVSFSPATVSNQSRWNRQVKHAFDTRRQCVDSGVMGEDSA